MRDMRLRGHRGVDAGIVAQGSCGAWGGAVGWPPCGLWLCAALAAVQGAVQGAGSRLSSSVAAVFVAACTGRSQTNHRHHHHHHHRHHHRMYPFAIHGAIDPIQAKAAVRRRGRKCAPRGHCRVEGGRPVCNEGEVRFQGTTGRTNVNPIILVSQRHIFGQITARQIPCH